MNDAPALKKANVGIAVAGATAAAKGAADIILTEVTVMSTVPALPYLLTLREPISYKCSQSPHVHAGALSGHIMCKAKLNSCAVAPFKPVVHMM